MRGVYHDYDEIRINTRKIKSVVNYVIDGWV